MKRDIIIRTLRTVIGGGLLAYLVFFFMNDIQIVQDFVSSYNALIIGILAAISIFILIMGVFSPCIPKSRVIQPLFGLFLIIFSYYLLKDDPSKYVFIGDILRILGVVLVIVGPIGLCVTNSCKDKQVEEKTEVIEV